MVFVPDLQKDVWGGYIPPYKDEIFSSWFFRLSQAHLLKSHSFSKAVLKGYSMWNRDNDLAANEDLIQILADNTPLHTTEINNLFLKSYEGFLYEKLNIFGFTTGIIPLKIYHRKRKGNSIMYCPSCLQNKPYYKKQWRIFYSIACTECGVELNDHCTQCKNPVTFHRLEQGYKYEILRIPLNHCAYCGYDISQNPIRASKIQLMFQKKINFYLMKGFTENLNYSHLYFSMLYKICSLISRENDQWGRLRKACCIEFGHLPDIKDKPFYLTNLEGRKEIILLSHRLIQDIDLLEKIIKKYNVRLSEFTKDKEIPFYYLNKLKSAT
ncbi:TniQ family protein [Chryseobacterium sp. MEBOG07]|uniref:TniQ family protein n=1 Tax=Chryseobacterium sp. MEBOG07 TaxID=2879939 RepID=UPI001F420EC0|nr:TniQ family protein [Chryseobacterium sp. MEBOG07]UKB79556.1 TniQ family protein [Chryseobacterium sp. MEBOG07]